MCARKKVRLVVAPTRALKYGSDSICSPALLIMFDSAAQDIPDDYARDFTISSYGKMDSTIPSFAGQLTFLMEEEKVNLQTATITLEKPVYTYNVQLQMSRGQTTIVKNFSDPLEDTIYSPSAPAYVYVNLDGFDFQCNALDGGENQTIVLNFPKTCGGIAYVNVTDGIKTYSITLAGKPNYTPLTGVTGYVGEYKMTFPSKTWTGYVTVTAVNEWNVSSVKLVLFPTESPPQQNPIRVDISWVQAATALTIISTIIYLAARRLKEETG